MELPQHWPFPSSGPSAAQTDELRDALLAAYSAPERRYHDTTHLAEMFARLEELAGAGVVFAERPVALAVWFHDAVYDGERDAEERSAAWAEAELTPLAAEGLLPPAEVAEVVRLVRLTEHHDPAPDDAAGAALSDADLAVLAAPQERYAQYAAAVRAEYAHLTDDEFREGRSRVLRAILDRAAIYVTPYALAHWEDAARANLAAELAIWEAAQALADEAATSTVEPSA